MPEITSAVIANGQVMVFQTAPTAKPNAAGVDAVIRLGPSHERG